VEGGRAGKKNRKDTRSGRASRRVSNWLAVL